MVRKDPQNRYRDCRKNRLRNRRSNRHRQIRTVEHSNSRHKIRRHEMPAHLCHSLDTLKVVKIVKKNKCTKNKNKTVKKTNFRLTAIFAVRKTMIHSNLQITNSIIDQMWF